MTNVYFVRHAEPDFSIHDDLARPLTEKGKADAKLVAEYLKDKKIDVVLSSPYLRAIDTVKPLVDETGLDIEIIEDFKERKIDNVWIDDFNTFCKKQWEDFDYKLSNGESLREVQNRNINALNEVLNKYTDKNIIIGTHGTALSTILNFYDNTYGYDNFDKIRRVMPWIVKMEFRDKECISITPVDILHKHD